MSEKIGRRRAIAVSVAGAAAIAGADALVNPEKAEAAVAVPLELPLTPTITHLADSPVTGGHKTTLTLAVKGSNGHIHYHNMIITRVGETMTIVDNIKMWNGQTFVYEQHSHTYSAGAGQNGTTQVSGQQVIDGTASQPLTLNYKNLIDPYTGITDPQTLVNAVFKNKRLS